MAAYRFIAIVGCLALLDFILRTPMAKSIKNRVAAHLKKTGTHAGSEVDWRVDKEHDKKILTHGKTL